MDAHAQRLDECVATLDRERMAIEIVFRLRENDEEHLFWVTVRGEDGAGLDHRLPIDRDHIEQAKRTKEPGWVEAEPQVLMLPKPVRTAVLAGHCGTSSQEPQSIDRHRTVMPRLKSDIAGAVGSISPWAPSLRDAASVSGGS